MNEEENKSFSQILEELESAAATLQDYPDSFIRESAARLKNNVRIGKSSIRGLNRLVFISLSLFAGAIISLIFTINYYNKANKIIEKSNGFKFDSISKKILGVQESDGIIKINYITTNNDSILSYPDLVKEHKRLIEISDSLSNYKIFEKTVRENFKIKMNVKKEGDKTFVVVESEKQ